ncbi:cytochrome c oxidase subunit II [Myxococcota bacterium]|nr:cytochrome c oxidase subunit II [Myxococcota bacterium]
MNDFLRAVLALPEQASTVARDADALHFLVISVTMLGATVVGLAAVYFVVRYRRREPDALTPKIKVPFLLEMVWVAGLLGLFIGIWLIGYKLFIRMSVPPPGSMEIYVQGKQWMWKFAYPDGRASISVLAVPVGRPVKLNMISQDVIHSFAVPAFRIKQDVLPSRYTTAWFEATQIGAFQILCTEYCGAGHSHMWGTVVVLSPEDYQAWLQGQTPEALQRARENEIVGRPNEARGQSSLFGGGIELGTTSQLSELGREVAARHACFACHTLDGRTHIGPTWRGLFGGTRTLASGETVIADPSYLTESMMDPNAKMVSGFAPVMPSYQGILSAAETAALVELIRSVREGEAVTGPFPGLPSESVRAPAGETTP